MAIIFKNCHVLKSILSTERPWWAAAYAGISRKRESETFKENMEKKKDKIVKRGVISIAYGI